MPENRNMDMAELVADLLEVARIEHAVQMGGYTKATAKTLGQEAYEAYLSGGAPGLNDWRRRNREAAIAKAEGTTAALSNPGTSPVQDQPINKELLDALKLMVSQIQHLDGCLFLEKRGLPCQCGFNDRIDKALAKAHAVIAKAEGK